MNFGQALAALMHGGSVTCADLGRSDGFLAMHPASGSITEPFIALHNPNGTIVPWSPTQEAILATNWSAVEGRQAAAQAHTQHEHAGAHV